ncbi:phospho-sugar mutase [Corynebacterium pygosceleis]|uniref:Phospho-sugar mutase n=1 Tax=Corynebacterium pygosceleis TaxID=2800406 RepID=A0A9Q4GME0_9CORY|nr:phospho-sugar mutase [Corynebacterium pygosceleis]MCK7636496.1 phospho-sugar mutase [Corynebacterium pygosceleis]MCK7675070.1 phospho-sugar mutase [Corynebacterium pygosceleis]MCL0121481.1 phospho-sugar mutase [Corynebacterium pygosceleis]MCX7469190.1 phospho-sugar mutase [Corynebacterium pygosceleis]
MTIIDRARDWASHDPDPATREELNRLIDSAVSSTADGAAATELEPRFAGPLTFGTAGLRGRVGAGETRMNRAVVTRATHGLMSWLNEQVDGTPTVVIGCDARHGSADFRKAAAGVVAAAGGRALVLPAQLPTPVTAFAVRHLGADAGIMVTASHNPPDDNGYKVYLGGRVAPGPAEGVQLIGPADAEIADAIAAAPPADEIALAWEKAEHVDVLDAYLARAGEIGRTFPAADGARPNLRVVLTPMHGVGGSTAVRALEAAGFTDVHLVPGQAEPDPDFPTVAFPNPEEPGALDLSMELAREIDADIIIALDPDADRCSTAVPDADAPGGWRQLTGDEIGALLGEFLASRGENGGTAEAPVLANSIVSGRLLGRIAEFHGLRHETTLTGFKWIARTPGMIFGYEEAIGYCCDPGHVRDKDGVTAAVTMCSLAADVKGRGRTLRDELDDLARTHGLHATAPLTFRVADTSLISEGMRTLRSTPPRELAGSPVVECVDLLDGYRGLPPTDGILLITRDDDRVIVRPSGTEPKLKCYLEVVLSVEDGGPVPHGTAGARLERIRSDMAAATGMG